MTDLDRAKDAFNVLTLSEKIDFLRGVKPEIRKELRRQERFLQRVKRALEVLV